MKENQGYGIFETAKEIERLELQSKFFESLSRNFFGEVGIKPGMNVLELGAGTGGVTKIIAELLKGEGSITAVDLNEKRLEKARDNLKDFQIAVHYQVHDLNDGIPSGNFDVIAGRMVLMYLDSPEEFIDRIANALNPAGIFAFQEPDHEDYLASHPPSPIYATWRERLFKTMEANQMNLSFGRQLPSIVNANSKFVDVYDSEEFHVSGGTGTEVYEVFAGVIRSVEDEMIKLGHIESTSETKDVQKELRREAIQKRLSVFSSKLIGVSANAYRK